ncbi:MAG: hypothetical protein JRJ49_09730 [Deltaproteobacteria bacterium]|nr:hypothetical protein [Deltaproteobacteria bacterium]
MKKDIALALEIFPKVSGAGVGEVYISQRVKKLMKAAFKCALNMKEYRAPKSQDNENGIFVVCSSSDLF